ncbi:DUF4381 family protein [Stenotrophomonas sp.]|jgi:hypothetical protein|uniref:DUF4381 family protein n=1 Tax=Stenotrophomonas sp. TaxID=69392 RepID=UPI0028A031B3|nr:DUF4381 family protein [Stenotrophomonas sp.]
MSAPTALPLRDVQLPPSPAWWPPAPGWWLVLGAVLLVAALLWGWQARRRRRRQGWIQLFDDAVAQAATPVEEVAAVAALLRRAARVRQPGAELLQGQAWLEFLDEPGSRAFSDGDGQLLLDGGYRPQVDAEAVRRLRVLARARFLGLVSGRRR